MGNLPYGEVCAALVESTAEGVLVCDGTVDDLGPAGDRPLRLRIRGGRVARIEDGDPAMADRLADRLAVDGDAAVVGEIGFGINPLARWTGFVLEDEKAARTAHVGLGANGALPGGRCRSQSHLDLVVHLPTVEIESAAGRRELVLRHGEAAACTFQAPKIALDETR